MRGSRAERAAGRKIRRKLAACGAAGLFLAALPAQAGSQEDLRARREKKLASRFLRQADWHTDYAAARAAAAKADKFLFAYFTRSFAP